MAKEKTPTQLRRKYKTLSNVCFGGEFVSVMAPFVGVGIANFESYFVEYDGFKMSIACFMALALMGLAVTMVASKKFENSYVVMIMRWATVAVIVTLMGKIVNDLASIMWWGLTGLLGAYGLDIGSKKLKRKAEKIQKGIDRAEEEMTAEAYKEEVRKVKVKVKK